ncbi:MAG TPA: hypothetical protein VFK44_02245 [Bacillales bacterium]|nr:hypothetical protein [Bacillales bacterium]
MAFYPLQAKHPEIYKPLTECLEQKGIHVFDVKAEAMIVPNTLETVISVKYGNDYLQETRFSMSKDELAVPIEQNKALLAFLEKTAESCRKATEDEYQAFMSLNQRKR